MKPIIGVLPLYDQQKESMWMLPAYFNGIIEAGGIPVMFPFIDDSKDIQQLLSNVDALLFTGGQDVDPKLYHHDPHPKLGTLCAIRDTLEKEVFLQAQKLHKPMLGICRGLQFINVMMGGTLYQDLPSEHPSNITHRQTAPHDETTHKVTLNKNTPLNNLLKQDAIMVNSFHHQAIKTLGASLEVMAVSDDGIIEGFYNEHYHIYAIQWHPEFLHLVDDHSKAIFKYFIDIVSKHMTTNIEK